jgi:hypothetical protein
MTYKKLPCPSCQFQAITDAKEVNSVLRIPVCDNCMDNFYSDTPNQKELNRTVDFLADELHDYINRTSLSC